VRETDSGCILDLRGLRSTQSHELMALSDHTAWTWVFPRGRTRQVVPQMALPFGIIEIFIYRMGDCKGHPGFGSIPTCDWWINAIVDVAFFSRRRGA